MRHAAEQQGSTPKPRPIGWFLLTALGVFAIVAAALFRFYLPGQVVKFPLNEFEIMTLQGTGTNYFNAAKLTELSGVTMQATLTFKGDQAQAQAAGNPPNIAFWRSFTSVRDITNHAPFQYSYAQFAFDRRTGKLVNCCSSGVGPRRDIHLSGQGFVWPLGTQKHSYQFFDTTALRPVTARYAGTASTAGITTYRFVAKVRNLQIGTQTVPGSLVGMKAASVRLPEIYSGVNIFWVDPVTGNPLKLSQDQQLTLRDSSGITKLVLFDGRLTTTPTSVRKVAAPDRASLNKINLITGIIPLSGVIVGVLLLGLALGLFLRRRGAVAGPAGERPAPEPASRNRRQLLGVSGRSHS